MINFDTNMVQCPAQRMRHGHFRGFSNAVESGPEDSRVHPGGEQRHPIPVVHEYEYVRFLIFAQSSCDETIDHLENLFDTASLGDENLYRQLHERLDTLGRKINAFTQAVETKDKKP